MNFELPDKVKYIGISAHRSNFFYWQVAGLQQIFCPFRLGIDYILYGRNTEKIFIQDRKTAGDTVMRRKPKKNLSGAIQGLQTRCYPTRKFLHFATRSSQTWNRSKTDFIITIENPNFPKKSWKSCGLPWRPRQL